MNKLTTVPLQGMVEGKVCTVDVRKRTTRAKKVIQ